MCYLGGVVLVIAAEGLWKIDLQSRKCDVSEVPVVEGDLGGLSQITPLTDTLAVLGYRNGDVLIVDVCEAALHKVRSIADHSSEITGVAYDRAHDTLVIADRGPLLSARKLVGHQPR